MAKSGVEYLAQHPGWKTKRKPMKPKVWKKKFDTLDEATGFAGGVDFVNDSALTVKSVKLVKGKWMVSIQDTDYVAEYPQKGREH